MATFFRTKVIKDIGTQKIVVFEVPSATNATVIGLNLANTTDFAVQGSILIKDDTSVEGFYVKDVMIPPQTAFKAMIGGEKIILSPPRLRRVDWRASGNAKPPRTRTSPR